MIDGARLDAWLGGLGDEAAGRALLALGVDHAHLGRAQAEIDIGGSPPAVAWTLTDEGFRHASSSPVAGLAGWVPPGGPFRLALTADTEPAGVVARLLAAPEVASAFVAVERPPGSLRRRPWRWPLRVGLLGFDADRVAAIEAAVAGSGRFPPELLDVRRGEDEPGAVDVLVVAGPLEEAVARVVALRPVANAVVVLGRALDRWPLVAAQLATARAATGAVASALADPSSAEDLVGTLVYEASHAQPFDVALTAAARAGLLLCAEPEAMERSTLPQATRRMTGELREVGMTMAMPPEVELAVSELETAAAGAFLGEAHEASTIAAANRTLESGLDAAARERWCQARVGADNLLRRGRNDVSVFIGPREAGALAAGEAFDDSSLPWEQAEAFKLTVVFVPLAPRGEPQQQELLLPRFGRTLDAGFWLDVAGAGAAARIVVLFRNRILQTALLSGSVGEQARLDEVAAIVPALTALDDRRPFDVALIANHSGGVRSLIRHSDGHTFVGAMPGLPPLAARIADVLARAAHQRSLKRGLRTPSVRKLLVALAQAGRELYGQLETDLGKLGTATRIQLVTARGQWFLPIEVAYERFAPDDDAAICERYLADPATCDGACTPREDRSTVCPGAFWGLSKTIERLHFDPAVEGVLTQGHLVLGRRAPRRGARAVVLERALLGASERVEVSDRDATVAALGPGAAAVSSWKEWAKALEAADTQLLVLLPHADYSKLLLEISDDGLRRSHIERTYVTGDRDVAPIVLLFGCRTTGVADDPAGFATLFITKGARAVFHSSTDLLNVHATALARRLCGQMTEPGHTPRLMSEVLATFRRDAVHDGLVAAFAITAYGDADWRI